MDEYFTYMSFMGIARTASENFANSLEAIKTVRASAQASKESDLKERISGLYESVLSLKEASLQPTEENLEQKQQIEELQRAHRAPQQMLRQLGSSNFYFVGEEGPYCRPCFDRSGTLTELSPSARLNGRVRRQCVLCEKCLYEQPGEGKILRTALTGLLEENAECAGEWNLAGSQEH